jgi:hypothetical protein
MPEDTLYAEEAWEYIVEPLPEQGAAQSARLTKLGRVGWRLVAVAQGFAYMERPCVLREAPP